MQQAGPGGSLRVLCPTAVGGEGEALLLPLPLPGIAALRQLVEQQFGPALPSEVWRWVRAAADVGASTIPPQQEGHNQPLPLTAGVGADRHHPGL